MSRGVKVKSWIWLGLVAGCLGQALRPAYSQGASSERLIAVGWVQAAGEIFIYARKSDLGRLYDGSCISGVMTNRRTLPKKLNNHHVRVYGRLMDSKELDDLVVQGISLGVENYCNSAKIAIITRIVEDTSQK
jgi:hypothetical protein